MIGKIQVIMAITIIAICVAFFLYFKYSQNRIEQLSSANLVLAASAESQKKIIDNMQNDISVIQEINKELYNVKEADTEQYRRLSETLSKLKTVDVKKAGLLEKLINRASKNRNRCLEIASGAKPLKDEKNTLCPQLVK